MASTAPGWRACVKECGLADHAAPGERLKPEGLSKINLATGVTSSIAEGNVATRRRTMPSDDLNVTTNHRTIEVQASCILESRNHGCTIFLIDGADRWHKFFGSSCEAFHEARILKLPDSALIRLFESSNEPAPTCIVDLDKIEELKYHKG
jgi:hypothetical protein